MKSHFCGMKVKIVIAPTSFSFATYLYKQYPTVKCYGIPSHCTPIVDCLPAHGNCILQQTPQGGVRGRQDTGRLQTAAH